MNKEKLKEIKEQLEDSLVDWEPGTKGIDERDLRLIEILEAILEEDMQSAKILKQHSMNCSSKFGEFPGFEY